MEKDTTDNVKNELKEIAPFLSSLPKKELLNTPENYFEKLPVDISNGIQAQKAKVQHPPLWQKIFRPQFALASLAIGIVGGIYLYNNIQPQQETFAFTNTNVQNLSDDDVLTQVDEAYLADALDDNNVITNDNTEEEYLIDNNTEINTIINAL
jgi:hypothetical protein